MMTLPIITNDTIQSLKRDLETNEIDMAPSVILDRIQADNPNLVAVIAALANQNMIVAAHMLYICELIDRQLESDRLGQEFGR